MPEKNYVTYGEAVNDGCACGCGCEGAKQITGCRFALSIMSDDYINIILGALAKVDTSKVWSETGKLSTVYRGKAVHVEDAVAACFMQAYREGVHMTAELTYSRGCPGDVDADRMLAEDDTLMNAPRTRDIHFPVACKIALYPLGTQDYMRHIAHVVNRAVDLGLYERSAHYCTVLSGDVQDLFAYFSEVNRYCAENLSHYVFEVTLSVNSPTKE